MEHQSPKSLLKSSTIFLALIIGVLVGIGVYQAGIRGYLPRLDQQFPSLQLPVQQKTQTVVDEESAVINVADKASPSVVAIGATRRIDFNPFDPFAVPRNQSSTIGTGFVVSEKGIIVTNKHVVDDPNSRYTVVTRDGKKFEIRKIYRDPTLDLAVIQIDEGGLKSLELGDSAKLKVGQTVVAIGNALGQFTNTVTRGVVSGLGRRVTAGDPFSGSAESLDDLIQTDAAINPGNSGGPLLNASGQVIGVNVATTEGAQSIGFAIPINSVKQIVDEFVQKGSVTRPFLGVRYRFISKDAAILYNVPPGAYVQEVIRGSSAERAGVNVGDIITKIDNQAVDGENRISEVIVTKKIGDKISLTLWNDDKERQAVATLQELPNQ